MSVLNHDLEVAINANGDYANARYWRPSYLIRLNADGSHWVYCRYGGEINRYGDYEPDLKWNYCRVSLRERPWAYQHRNL